MKEIIIGVTFAIYDVVLEITDKSVK